MGKGKKWQQDMIDALLGFYDSGKTCSQCQKLLNENFKSRIPEEFTRAAIIGVLARKGRIGSQATKNAKENKGKIILQTDVIIRQSPSPPMRYKQYLEARQ